MNLNCTLPRAAAILCLSMTAFAQGPGGPGARTETKLVEKFDANNSGVLERDERDAARAALAENPRPRRRGRPRGGASEEPRQPGPEVSPADVETYSKNRLYDTSVLRTLFLTFEHDDWEEELAAFYRSDVEVPATLTVDGQRLDQVGIRFRGNTSFMMVPAGQKRSMNVSLDLVHRDQRLDGYKTLNLLNCHGDPSMLREVLHAHIGRQFAPVPQANLVHVVINGESWGVYANVQQVNKDYLKEAFGTRKGARWRVPPDFSGNAGLKYLGDDPKDYESYTPKSGVDEVATRRLVELCRVLNESTIAERLEKLPGLLDIDDALWFLAIDNILLDGDGYLTRASDYALYMDPMGVFHPLTYDNNEILGGSARRGGPRGGPPGPGGDRGPRGRPDGPPGGGDRGGRGPGRRRGRGGPGGPGGHRIEATQSPLAGSDDANRPLLHRLLEVPQWRARYLTHVHSMATRALAWEHLGPEVQRLHELIADVTRNDTRKLYDQESFEQSVSQLREISEKRYRALLQHETLAGDWPSIVRLDAEERVTDNGRRLSVVAQVGDAVEIASARLFWQKKRPGTFTSIEMEPVGDDSFRAELPVLDAGEKIHYYVEVRAAGDSGRLAFAPMGASSLPRAHVTAKK